MPSRAQLRREIGVDPDRIAVLAVSFIMLDLHFMNFDDISFIYPKNHSKNLTKRPFLGSGILRMLAIFSCSLLPAIDVANNCDPACLTL
jgi:hypothetical protein